MSQKPDDLEAIKIISNALEPFDEATRERILRWVSERIGLKTVINNPKQGTGLPLLGEQIIPPSHLGVKDIKTFLDEKQPTSANQLVAAVAYYYKFEASANEKKSSINRDDLMEACRKSNRERPKHPNQVLINAAAFGLVDKTGTGLYEINAVGENLVAVSMPTSGHGNSSAKKSAAKTKR